MIVSIFAPAALALASNLADENGVRTESKAEAPISGVLDFYSRFAKIFSRRQGCCSIAG
jgi:hypothetical protein